MLVYCFAAYIGSCGMWIDWRCSSLLCLCVFCSFVSVKCVQFNKWLFRYCGLADVAWALAMAMNLSHSRWMVNFPLTLNPVCCSPLFISMLECVCLAKCCFTFWYTELHCLRDWRIVVMKQRKTIIRWCEICFTIVDEFVDFPLLCPYSII